MAKPVVYVETSVLSYYFDNRPALKLHIDRTRQWWDGERQHYDCFTSVAVLEELAAGVYAWQEQSLALAATLTRVDLIPAIDEIVDTYVRNYLLPKLPVRDAVHVAAASYYGIDFLLTWNCQHLANANKAVHLETLNRRLNLKTPRIITPLQLQLTDEKP